MKTGRGPSARRAAASHTAALSGEASVALAALRQAGVHVVDDGLTLLSVAAALERQPPLRGRRIGVITNSGGTGVELTDLLEAQGLAVPALSPMLQSAVAGFLPPLGSAVNPIDVTTDWLRFAEMYASALSALIGSDEIDAVVPVLLQRSALIPEVAQAVVDATRRACDAGSTKPVHVCWVAPRAAEENREKLVAAGIPCHAWPAATAVNIAATFAREPCPLPKPEAMTRVPAPKLVDAEGWVGAADAFASLEQEGLPVARWAVVTDAREAAERADALGYPVVLKAERPGLVHKSDADAVRVGLCERAGVVRAFEDFRQRLGPGPALLQEQATSGVELVIGARRDPSFGPVIMAGLGGVWVEALGDVTLRLSPICEEEALGMFEDLKGRKLLAGLRGRKPVDRRGLARLVSRLSLWFCATPWLDELDLNPVIAHENDFMIVDARMRVLRSVQE